MQAVALRCGGWLGLRNAALLSFQVHTSLRAGDWLALVLEDERVAGGLHDQIVIRHQKTGVVLLLTLVPTLRAALSAWLGAHPSGAVSRRARGTNPRARRRRRRAALAVTPPQW